MELTEHDPIEDYPAARAALDRLGPEVRVSVDDFGTGNASIEYLAELPASELKIDRAFVTDILASRRDRAIVRSTRGIST